MLDDPHIRVSKFFVDPLMLSRPFLVRQIQESIAQIFQRQSEALVKRRTTGKDLAGGFITRSQRNLRSAPSRRRRNARGNNNQGSEDNEDENDSNGGKDSGSADERGAEIRQRRRKRRRGSRQRQPSSSADGECIENDMEAGRVSRGVSPGIVWNPEMLAWGRGGTRSHTRHGGNNGSSKNSRNNRLSKLVDHLRSLEENDEVLKRQPQSFLVFISGPLTVQTNIAE